MRVPCHGVTKRLLPAGTGTSIHHPRAFTILEVLVVVAIISLLISIMLPSLQRARDQSNILVCKTRLAQLYNGHCFYAQEARNGVFPHWSWWLYDGVNHSKPKIKYNPTLYAVSGGVRFSDSRRWVEYGDLYRYLKNRETYFCPVDDRIRRGSAIGSGGTYGNHAIHSYVRLMDPHDYLQEKIDGKHVADTDQLLSCDFVNPDHLKAGAFKSTAFPRVSQFMSTPNRVVLMYEEYQGFGDRNSEYYLANSNALNDGHSYLRNISSNSGDRLSTRHLGKGNILFWDGHADIAEAKRWNRYPNDMYPVNLALGGGYLPKR
ncbi:MAG: type II secretion system protein [Phycisphaerae bacterium]|nr:type II secretion system protein [Phycisphaerae bacterium]